MSDTAAEDNVVKSPQQAQKEQFDREEKLRYKQEQYDPKIHGVGTVYVVEPQSVKELYHYCLALEARIKQLEYPPERQAVASNKPTQMGTFPVHAPADPTTIRNEYAAKMAEIKSVPLRPIPPATSVEKPKKPLE